MRAARRGRAPAQHDQPCVDVAALRHRGEGAHVVRDDRLTVEQLDLERLVLVRDLRRALGEKTGVATFAGRFCRSRVALAAAAATRARSTSPASIPPPRDLEGLDPSSSSFEDLKRSKL